MARNLSVILAIVGGLLVGRLVEAAPAVVISIDNEGQLAVEMKELDRVRTSPPQAALVVWGEDNRDTWVHASKLRPWHELAPASTTTQLIAGTRGESSGYQPSVATTTQQLDQLVGAELLRAFHPGGFITPAEDSTLVNPKITIRRHPREQSPVYPVDELILYRGRIEVARFPIAEGASKLEWSDIEKLSDELKNGLPAGSYLLESQANNTRTQFSVLPIESWKRVRASADTVGKLLGDPDDPLATQLLVEALLAHADDEGRPSPLVSDALDVLSARRTSYLDRIFKRLNDELAGKTKLSETISDSTGVRGIDAARDYIAHGNWRSALDALKTIPPDSPQRVRGLAILYEAVVLAESGPATGADAEAAFHAALNDLSSQPATDAYRAHHNFANFLLRRSQDRLYNHAFLAATGGQEPLLHSLGDWMLADREIKEAQRLAKEVDVAATVAVKVNIARQYLLLVDVLNVLNSGLAAKDRFQAGEQAAIEKASATATELVATANAPNDAMTLAIAHEILSQLAYRQANFERCRSEANSARQIYLDQGNLVAVEGIERLLGLTYLREPLSSPERLPERNAHALRHFLLSHELAEALRKRFPRDKTGLSQAGFFARRAYVNEKIIELYLSSSQPEQALAMAESAKFRALSDVLMLQQQSPKSTSTSAASTASKATTWPDGMVALEYFLGSDRAWVFVIHDKKVKAFPLVDRQGKPIESRRLISDVQRFLVGIESSSEKMLQQFGSGRPFDASWQDQLHEFYDTLIPEEARKEVEQSKELLIIPHHILHYFPFAALVTQVDSKPRKPLEMPLPKFLIEQGQTICYAPSLRTWEILRSRPQVAHEIHAIAISDFASERPLPGVKKDLANLQAAFVDVKIEVVQETQATEDRIRAVLQQPGFTFIGTHGVNVADQPLASFLLCEPGDNDGRYSAAEIYKNTSGAEVVVLSACYSGLGDRSPLPGDDLFGLQRALLHTGVGVVVAGLWDVYDDTGVEIMRDFFIAVRAGDTMPQALAVSQRKFLAARRAAGPTDVWIHPYFWAVYKSTGSDLTRFEQVAKSNSN